VGVIDDRRALLKIFQILLYLIKRNRGNTDFLLDAVDKRVQYAYPIDDVSSSFFERVIVIIETCLVVSSLQREIILNSKIKSSCADLS
jgi:hypothetical protein